MLIKCFRIHIKHINIKQNLLFAIFLFANSYATGSCSKIDICNNEVKVIDNIFLKLIDTNYYNNPFDESDTSKVAFFINDTLRPIYQIDSDISEYPDSILRNNFSIDTTFYELYHQLFSKTKHPTIIKLDEIRNTGLYNLFTPQDGKANEKNYRVIGTLTFSRFSFNKDLTRCCFYLSLDCGHDCGCGYIVFLNKRDDNWYKEYEISIYQK